MFLVSILTKRGNVFYDRQEAGQKLAKAISKKRLAINKNNALVLALPRGGVIVGREIARLLNIPLDIVVTKKIGFPGNPEYAIGAVGESGELVMGNEIVDRKYLEKEIEVKKEEIKRRLVEYRGTKSPPDLRGKTVILVDDGLATGLSMKAAVNEVRAKKPAQIIIAVPVASPESIDELKEEVNELICLKTPRPFFAIGNFYTNFEQVTDEEVKTALRDSDTPHFGLSQNQKAER